MAIEDVLARISSIQARFGVPNVSSASEFEGVLSDAARHAGVQPGDPTEGGSRQVTTVDEVATANEVATDGDAGEAAPDAGTTTQAATPAPGTGEPPVAILDDQAATADVRSGEALEALSAAAAPAFTTAAALGATGSGSLLELLESQLDGGDGTAVLASIIAQQQAGLGITRATDS